MLVGLFPVGNMGYDGIEGPIVEPTDNPAYGMGNRVVGFNVWHGSDPSNPRGWDKNGADRRFKTDMAGLAVAAVLDARFTGECLQLLRVHTKHRGKHMYARARADTFTHTDAQIRAHLHAHTNSPKGSAPAGIMARPLPPQKKGNAYMHSIVTNMTCTISVFFGGVDGLIGSLAWHAHGFVTI